jgi:glycosyltransferase involved in cell wall biosynthesis
MNKKRILIFVDWYLPGYKAGGPIQSIANMVASLKEDFDISIITRDTDYSETTPYTTVKSNEWNVKDGIRVYYISSDKLNYFTIYNLLKQEPSEYVYLNGIYSLYFTLIPLFIARKQRSRHIVVAARGMLSKGSLGVKKVKKDLFLRTAKLTKLFGKVTFHATTDIENKEIHAALGRRVIVKTAANLASATNSIAYKAREKKAGALRLVNIARIAPEKNLLFALKVLQQVKTSVVFDFYGPVYDHPYWEQCKEAIRDLPANVKATYKESIESEKVMSTLQLYHGMFMPSTGENFGHIILQSFTAGCPVIISDRTPWRQLKNKNCGWDISLSHAEKFVETIDAFNHLSQEEYDALSKSAFAYGIQYMNNPVIIEENKALFNE